MRVFEGKRINVSIHGQFELVEHPGAVVILARLDPDTVVLIRNERFAVGETLLELPAGTLEPDERPIDCAARELEEETGYLAKSLKPLIEFYSTPGFSNEKLYLFEASELIKTKQNLDENERIEVELFSMSQALQMIHSGQIRDAKTIASLLYLHTYPE